MYLDFTRQFRITCLFSISCLVKFGMSEGIKVVCVLDQRRKKKLYAFLSCSFRVSVNDVEVWKTKSWPRSKWWKSTLFYAYLLTRWFDSRIIRFVKKYVTRILFHSCRVVWYSVVIIVLARSWCISVNYLLWRL